MFYTKILTDDDNLYPKIRILLYNKQTAINEPFESNTMNSTGTCS